MKKEMQQQAASVTKEIAKEFRSRFAIKIPGINYEYISSDNPILKIPARSKNFGHIDIYINFREITVVFGDKHHTHFDINFSREDISDNDAKQIISEVLEFIEEILRDKVLLKVKMYNDRVISTSIVYKDNISKPTESMWTLSGLLGRIFSIKAKTILYSWSGAVKEIE